VNGIRARLKTSRFSPLASPSLSLPLSVLIVLRNQIDSLQCLADLIAMTGYTKLFSSLIGSTVWREPDHVRLVWITMLALRNQFHVVEASIPGLADFARVPMDKCQEALAVLMAPDPYSRTKDHEGRRIREVDGGWEILNGGKYRAMMNADERREANRIYQQRHQAKKKAKRNGLPLPGENLAMRAAENGGDVGVVADMVNAEREANRGERGADI